MIPVCVIGGGVSGLSCALRLLQAGFDVTVVTRDMPANTTSAAAGAVWWGHLDGQARQWAWASLKHFQQLIPIADSGVLQIRLRDVFPYRVDPPWFRDEIPYCEHIPADQLPPGYVDGFLMDVPLVEPPRYLAYLMHQIQQQGGRIEYREVASLHDCADYPIVVNCSGVGARELAHDTQVYPIRGQTVRVDAPQIQYGYMDDHTFTYIFPRKDGVLLGGIAQPHNYSLEIDSAITDDIIRRCARVEPVIAEAEKLGEAVGLRPGRYTVRLEAEALTESCTVIHNYGHAGVGFTLSWGCAESVAALVNDVANKN